MAAPQSPIGSRRRLGAELRRLRNQAGLTLDDVAERMTCSTSKISRLETGKGIPKVPDVRELMRIYGVNGGAEQDELLQWVHDGREHGWWEPLTDGVAPERFVMDTPGRYASLESDAVRVRSFDPAVIFGLMQTEGYARVLLGTMLPHHPPGEIDQLVALRMMRQEAMRRVDPPPLELEAVIDEAVLHRQVGGPEVMAVQLEHLRELADRPNVTVRVLPFSAGLLRSHIGQFALLDIPPERGSGVVYIEGHAGETFLDEASHVDLYKDVFAGALRRSLPVDVSTDLIARYASQHAPRSERPIR